MKKYVFAAIAAVGGLLANSGVAQQHSDLSLPVDSKVKIGKLPNGLTYYIRKNDIPEQRAEFFIVQRVGSMLENESQQGLAHFLEHMAFNGTKNFPGDRLIKYCESIGVKFGENINAYTAFDETVYNISNVPTTRSTIIDSALLVLHDWSNCISLEDKEIDKERGVIREEWRTRNTGQNRVGSAYFKEVYPNNITGTRMPIGSIDVINSFSYQQLRDYYKKWYRPDLQAIIIVGDVEVADVEARIKSIFADISRPVNPTERTYVAVEDNQEPIVSIVTDPEVNKTSVSLMYKMHTVQFTERNSRLYYVRGIVQNFIAQMLNARFAEISQKSNPPFQGAGATYGNYIVSKTKDAWTTGASAKSGEALNALKAIVRENERMHRFGFSVSELERVKVEYLRNFENAFNEREKQKSGVFVQEYVNNFTTNEPIPGIEFEFDLVKKVLPSINVEDINRLAKSYVSDTNMVIVVTGPHKEGVYTPTKEEVLAAVADIQRENIEPYQDKVITEPLLATLPKGGKVVQSENAPFGYTKWKLSNGAKVFIKKTDFKKDQILMHAFSEGGTSLFNEKERANYSIINEVVPLGGLGGFDPMELNKVLNGKIVGISANVGSSAESLSGNTTPKDFESLMQLTFLKITQPRMDEVAFKNYVSRKRNQLEIAALNPASALSDSIRTTLYDRNPFMSKFDLEMLNKVDYARVVELYKERFANAGDFTFILTGNIDSCVVKPMVELYLGGLPSSTGTEKWKDRGVRMVKGVKTVDFEKVLSVPKSSVFVCYSGTAKYSMENSILMDFVSSILDFRYTEAIREKEGASYGVSVGASIDIKPIEQYMLQISFDTDPKLKSKMLAIVHQEIKNFIEKGPSLEDISKVREFMLKRNQDMQVENRFWLNILSLYLQNQVDFSTTYSSYIKSITPEMVKNAAKEWLDQGNIVEVIMNPKSDI